MKQNRDWNLKEMRVIGLTGGVGCGKSFVAAVLSKHFPIYVLYTDSAAVP